MNKTYIYDDTFSSLLALIECLILSKVSVNNIKSKSKYQPSLLDEPVHLNIDNIEEKVKSLKSKLTPEVIHTIYYAYLSDNPNKEIIIYNYIKNAIIYKNQIFYRRNIDSVVEIEKMSKYVGREAHKLKGFLRFKEMNNNFYYAEIEPTNNVIGILANHFKNRLSNESWIIKDTKRNIYALYDTNKVFYLTDKDIIKLSLDLSNNEDRIEELWKTFFKTVAIKERTNLKCQMNFMPKKYWKNMIEMEDKK